MKKILLTLVGIISLSACNDVIFEEDLASSSPKDNFEYLWRECDEKYSFFELKEIDWDEVYNRYEPRITEDMSRVELFNTLGEMLRELKDDHTNLFSRFNVSFFGVSNVSLSTFSVLFCMFR